MNTNTSIWDAFAYTPLGFPISPTLPRMEVWEEGERGPGEREGWRLATPGDGGTCPCPEPTYHLVVGFSLEVDELAAGGREGGGEGRGGRGRV